MRSRRTTSSRDLSAEGRPLQGNPVLRRAHGVSVHAGGSGYVVGDEITLSSAGSGCCGSLTEGESATLKVTAVDGDGAVTAIEITSAGTFFHDAIGRSTPYENYKGVIGANERFVKMTMAVSGGSGQGAEFTVDSATPVVPPSTFDPKDNDPYIDAYDFFYNTAKYLTTS